MAAKKSRLIDAEKLLIHEFQNCVHKINMELDLAELGLVKEFKYAGLTSAVDLMNRSLEDLRVRLVRMEASHRGRWRASMDKAKARQKIRDNLDSGDLPRDFDLTLESFFNRTS
jgi:hypothetical protein